MLHLPGGRHGGGQPRRVDSAVNQEGVPEVPAGGARRGAVRARP